MDTDLEQLLKALIRNTKLASLGTSENNLPYVSMMPYSVSKDDNEFYILAADNATHTKNLQTNPNVSLLICQPAHLMKNPQSLARVTVSGPIEMVSETESDYEEIKEDYIKKNPTTKEIFTISSFHLYRIKIREARYVAGFGQVYSLTSI